MKKQFFSKTCKQKILAIPAAALMLGASHGATVGINYTANWGAYAANGGGTNGYGINHYSYMTSGMNVAGTAFGVPASSWTNIQLQYYQTITNTTTVGQLTILTQANDVWTSGIGNTNTDISYANFAPAMVVPGNDDVTWAYLDDDVTHTGYTLWNVSISGLKTAYPNGYTIQTIGYPWLFPAPNVNITDSTTFTNSLPYTSLGQREGAWGTTYAGISAVSPVMTSDSVTIYGDPPVGNKDNMPIYHSTLCGFIIADASSGALTLQIVGNNVVWTSGVLQSSPTLGPNATWTTLTDAVSPYPILPSTAPQMFYRLIGNAP